MKNYQVINSAKTGEFYIKFIDEDMNGVLVKVANFSLFEEGVQMDISVVENTSLYSAQAVICEVENIINGIFEKMAEEIDSDEI